MRRLVSLLSLTLALLFFAVSVQPQTKPDFNGTWKQNNAKSKFSRGSGPRSYVNKIEYHDPNLRVVTTIGGDRGEYTYERTYTTDGKEKISKDREGDEFRTAVRWEGPALLFEITEVERGQEITTTEKWTLSEDGETLTKVHRTSGPRGESEQIYVLEKQ